MPILGQIFPLGSALSGSAVRQLERFRSMHRPGQKVKGRIISYQDSRTAWVRIQGQDLLAYLYSNPPEGREVTFLIEKLHPQVVLKEQNPDGPAVNIDI